MTIAIETYCRTETIKDRANWLELFADNIVHEDPVGIPACIRSGIGALEKFWEMIDASNVDLWLTEEVIICGNEAIAMMACETGPAENRCRRGPIVDHFIFNDAGKITNVRAFYNLP